MTVEKTLSETINHTWNPSPPAITTSAKNLQLAHTQRGISGEAGEIADCLKKYLDYGSSLDIDNLEEEVGDILYYLKKLCMLTGITFESAVRKNREKLLTRYPEGFSLKASEERADKQG